MHSGSEETDIRVPVDLGTRSYEVRVVSGRLDAFGPFARDALEATWSGRSCRRALIVTDAHLADLSVTQGYEAVFTGLGIESTTTILPAGRGQQVARPRVPAL